MIDQNAAGFTTVYKKAEHLFKRLVAVQDKFKDWVVLGTVDLDKLVETNLDSVPDWERNFRALKARGREAEKLPMWVGISVCFVLFCCVLCVVCCVLCVCVCVCVCV